MDKALAELINISNLVGCDTKLVQASGGNTSVKTDNGKFMYIKASGTALKDMEVRQGWRRVDIAEVISIIADKNLSMLTPARREKAVAQRLLLACNDKFARGPIPSIETHLHVMLDKYVIHLHPDTVAAFVNAKLGKTELEKLFADETMPILWIPYADPGFSLAKKITGLIRRYKKQHSFKPAIIFLQKHGLIVSANSRTAALKILRSVMTTCRNNLQRQPKVRVKKIATEIIDECKGQIKKAYKLTTEQRDFSVCRQPGCGETFKRGRDYAPRIILRQWPCHVASKL